MSPINVPGKMILRKNFSWEESTWTPAEITTELWLDAADGTTLFTTSTGSTLSTNGSPVGRWNDKSGNNRNCTQVVTNQIPTYNSSANAIEFSGDRLIVNSVPNLGSEVTLFFICNASSGPIGLFDSAPQHTNTIRNYDSGQWDWWNASPQFNLGVTTGQISMLALQHSLSGSTRSVIYRRNGQEISVNTAVNSNPIKWTNPEIGAIDRIPQYAGAVMEVTIAQNSALASNALEKMEGYLAHKWGLAANLPAGHPYKLVPPIS